MACLDLCITPTQVEERYASWSPSKAALVVRTQRTCDSGGMLRQNLMPLLETHACISCLSAAAIVARRAQSAAEDAFVFSSARYACVCVCEER
jgi:hypothetical protein